MRLNRFYQPGDYHVGEQVVMDERVFQHAIKVLRLQLGDKIIVFNGLGKVFLAEIARLTKKECEIDIIEQQDNDMESSLKMQLCCGIIKSDKMDWLLQKAVELGVQRLTPLITNFTDIKFSVTTIQKKMQHWQAVIISACEQSGRNNLPLLDKPILFSELFKQDLWQPIIFCNPGAEQNLSKIKLDKSQLSLIIGPEGGFATEEIALMLQQNCVDVSLGARILRAETAAIAALTICQHLWGDM